MNNEYIGIVYQNPLIQIIFMNNFKSITAVDNIKVGELLLIEHVYTNKRTVAKTIIEHNEYLFDHYHPRITTFNATNDKNIMAIDKLSHNCFGTSDNNVIITDFITMMNHSCEPNCAVFIQEKYNIKDNNIIFMEVYAMRPIKKDAELFISYGPKTGHERDFECKCGKELNEREKIYNIISKIAAQFSFEKNNMIKKKICKYLKTQLSKKILLNQFLSKNGIFVNKDNISAFTEEGSNMINNVVHKFINFNPDKIPPNSKIKEVGINQHKINIFLHVLNNGLLSQSQSQSQTQTQNQNK